MSTNSDEIERALAPVVQSYKDLANKLDKHELKLDRIGKALEYLAVQENRIGQAETKLLDIYAKWNALVDPKDGPLWRIQQHQASCPRRQVQAMWFVLVPLCGLILAVTGLVLKQL